MLRNGPHREMSSIVSGYSFASHSWPFGLVCASWYFSTFCMQPRPAAPWSAQLCQFGAYLPAIGFGDIVWIFPSFSALNVFADSRSLAIWYQFLLPPIDASPAPFGRHHDSVTTRTQVVSCARSGEKQLRPWTLPRALSVCLRYSSLFRR